MTLNIASIRAAAAAADGDKVALTKAQLDELLDAIEVGQRARRELAMIGAVAGAGTARVSH